MSGHCRSKVDWRLLGLALGSALIATTLPPRALAAIELSLGIEDPADDTRVAGFAKGHALVVAVANYQHVNRLPPSVVNDGQAVYDLLTSREYCGYLPGNVTLLLDEQATAGNIRDALQALARDTKPGDTVVVFFSGHGGRIGPKGAEKTFLLPVDFDLSRAKETGLDSDDLTKLLGDIKADRLVVLLDACHAAGAGELKAVVPAEGIKAGLGNDAYDALATGRGRAIVASCLENEFSVVLPGAKNSLFTEKLLEALKGSAGSAGDGAIRILDVFRYVALNVPKYNKNQHPLLRTNLQDDFAVSLFRGGSKATGGGPSRPKPEARDLQPGTLPGPNKLALMNRLVDRWNTLAVYLEIPQSDQRRFPQGEEPKALLEWLEQRDQLSKLRPAFEVLHYDDLIRFLPEVGTDNPGAAPKTFVPKTREDRDRLAMMRKILVVLEHIPPGSRPGTVIQSVRDVLNGLDKEELGRLLEGEVSEDKNLLRYAIANALDVVASASLGLYQYQEALSAYREQFEVLDPIYAANPRWHPLPQDLTSDPRRLPGAVDQMGPSPSILTPVCELVLANRLSYCTSLHASLDSRVDDATRNEIRSALRVAADAIGPVNTSKMRRALMWFSISSAYYMNGDLDLSKKILGQAVIDYGPLPPESLMEDEDRDFLSRHHLLLAGILAEQGDTSAAARMISSAKPFATNLYDVRGVAGYDYLLIARITKDQAVSDLAIQNAVHELDNDHSDVACRYNLACALAMRCQREASVAKDRDLRRATELLLSVINTLKSSPIEPQVSAIGKDPFLKPVVAQPEVTKALETFEWSPYRFRPPLPVDELWHYGVPMRRFRFTRLNGDDRN